MACPWFTHMFHGMGSALPSRRDSGRARNSLGRPRSPTHILLQDVCSLYLYMIFPLLMHNLLAVNTIVQSRELIAVASCVPDGNPEENRGCTPINTWQAHIFSLAASAGYSNEGSLLLLHNGSSKFRCLVTHPCLTSFGKRLYYTDTRILG